MGFMDTLKRIPKILEANLNDLLDRAEDPEKMIEQLLRDYKTDAAEIKKDTAEVKALAKQAKRDLDEIKEDIARKTTAAENALKAGNEADAAKLIEMKQKAESRLAQAEKNYEIASANEQKMVNAYNEIVSRIKELEARKDTIKTTTKLANAQEGMNDMLSRASSVAQNDSFDKFERKANARLDAAMAEAELNAEETADDDLVAKYGSGASSSVNDEMAAMKARLGLE